MQTIWKGAISFGLVSIPVRLYAATEERSVSFHQVHAEDGGRVRYKRVCSVDGEEVPYADIAKGYQLPDGDTIVLTDEDFASLPLSSSRTVDVIQFVPTEQIDPIAFARSYYLQADGPGAKPYVLLRDALARSGRIAIVKIALRQREALATLRPRDDVLVLQTMLWPDEVRSTETVAPSDDVTVRDQEIAMAESYIETLSGDFDPSEHSDDYRHALEELVEAKAAGREVRPAAEEEPARGNVVDLMEALRASVAAAKEQRGGAAAAAGGSGAAKKAGAKKATKSTKGTAGSKATATAKKAGAKKAGAKKTAAARGAKGAKGAKKASTRRSA